MHSTRPHRVFLEGQLALPQARFDPPDRRLWSLAMPLPAFAGRDGGDETLSWRAKPGSSCPVRNDETTSTPPDMCPESGPQPHAGHAGGTRQYGRDPSGAAWPRPRSFRVEPSHEKTKNAPTNFFRRMEGSGGLRWQSQAAAPRVAEFDQLRRAATPHTITGPKLPYGAPPGPVMYPSLANFKIRNSSVRRPR